MNSLCWRPRGPGNCGKGPCVWWTRNPPIQLAAALAEIAEGKDRLRVRPGDIGRLVRGCQARLLRGSGELTARPPSKRSSGPTASSRGRRTRS